MDKKIKNAGDKIKMPEDMKERIINNCESAAKTNIIRTNGDDGYIEVVRGTDRVNSKNRIVKVISAFAACAVLIAGIGTTGIMLHRQNNKLISSDANDEAYRIMSPFGDFSSFKYSFDAGDGKYGSYSAETYEKLSDFLNKFDWGEIVEKKKDRDKEADVEEPMYNIKWTKGDTPPVECNLHIANDGYVSYYEMMMNFETGALNPIDDFKWYKIDFDTFDIGIKDVLAVNIDKTPFGDFSTFDFILTKGDYENISAEVYERLADYLNKFEWGDEVADNEFRTPQEVSEEIAYNLHWKIGRKDCHLYIVKDGHVHYNANVTDDDSYEITTIDERNYNIDFNVFDNNVMEILAGAPDTLSPFGDFRNIDFGLVNIDGLYVDRSTEVHSKIAEFLNRFNWGERHELGDTDTPTVDHLIDVRLYLINWEYEYNNGATIVPRKCIIQVNGDGKVYYNCYENIYDTGKTHCVDREWHEIDFNAFDRGIKEIIEQAKDIAQSEIDVSGKNENPSGNELVDGVSYDSIYDILKSVELKRKAYLKGYPDVEMVVGIRDADDNEIMLSDESMEKIKTFVENEFKFDSMLKSDPINEEYSYEFSPQAYGIDIRYMYGGKEVLGRYYNIMGDGKVILSDCEYDSNGGSRWLGPFSYYIDLSELYAKLEECGVR